MAGLTAEDLAQRLDIHVDIVKRSLASLKEKGLVEIQNDCSCDELGSECPACEVEN